MLLTFRGSREVLQFWNRVLAGSEGSKKQNAHLTKWAR